MGKKAAAACTYPERRLTWVHHKTCPWLALSKTVCFAKLCARAACRHGGPRPLQSMHILLQPHWVQQESRRSKVPAVGVCRRMIQRPLH